MYLEGLFYMKKILINSREKEETRIAIVEDNQLIDLDIESIDREQKKSNIYKAKISRIEPSLNAVFINYGEDKNGFLPYKEIAPEYFSKNNEELNIPLNELLEVNQELIVQIVKEERGSKGAALTTFITLAGCYMVIMPNNPTAGGISRRVEGEERQKLKKSFDALSIPTGIGVIIRTAGVDRSVNEIQADLDTLISLYDAIKNISNQHKAPFLIHKESDITIRAIRDYLKEDVQEIIIDDAEAYQDLKRQLTILRPHFLQRLKIYDNDTPPLFNSHHIEKQIESAFKREVTLASGGSIIVDTTEALTAIDINSARATKGENIEETALATNLEAAVEISRQLRLRDLGGLIIVDFIDMGLLANQKALEQKLIEALMLDRAKIQMTQISKFGLVEISRQRLKASLGESVMLACPRCEGHGLIRSIPSLSLSILRNIRTEVRRDKTNEIRVQLPADVATFLLNEKRDEIKKIEQNSEVKILLIPNPNMQSPHFVIQRIWGDAYYTSRSSIDLIEKEINTAIYKIPKQNKLKEPALKTVKQKNSNRKQILIKIVHNIIKSKQDFWSKLIAFFSADTNKSRISSIKKCSQTKVEKSNVSNLNKQANTSNNKRRYEDKQKRGKNNDRSDRIMSNSRYLKYDSRNINNSTAPRYSNRLQVHQSQDIIDISDINKPSLNILDNDKEKAVMKVISRTPEDKISIMVKEILRNNRTLSSSNSYQVETHIQKTIKEKYLKFKVILLDQGSTNYNVIHTTDEKSKDKLTTQRKTPQPFIMDEKKTAKKDSFLKKAMEKNTNIKETNTNDHNAQNSTSKRSFSTPDLQMQKNHFITYSPAIDSSSQGFIDA